jgi:hypothetical protein
VNQKHCKLTVLLAICVSLFLLSCKHEDDKPLLQISFNGSLQTNDGIAPTKSFEADYSGFLKRQALKLRSGDIAIYKIPVSDVPKGTMEFWMKINSAVHSPIRLIRITSEVNSAIELFLQEKGIGLSLRRENNVERFRGITPFQKKGQWMLVDLKWDLTKNDQNSFELYLDGEPQQLEGLQRSKLTSSKFADSSHRLTIGIPNLENDSNQVLIGLRDLILWNNVSTEKRIRASFTAGQQQMDKGLVWPATDLEHFAGKKARITGATNGVGWTIDTIIGRKEGIILPGKAAYELTFRAKPFTKIAEDNFSCEIYFTDATANEIELARWKNSAADFADIGKFKSYSIRFNASPTQPIGFEFQSLIPAKASLLLDTISLRSLNSVWEKQWRFEDIEHTMGVWQEDSDASGGRGWINAHTLHYGPYTCIGQPGRYRATWRIRVAPDVDMRTPLVLLDVFAHDGFLGQRKGNKSYAKFQLDASQFQRLGVWENKSIEFNYDGADTMEFRAFARTLQSPSFAIDTITVTRVD